MSNLAAARVKTKKWEGGYAKAYGTSGETYGGVDRKYNPNWKGWVIVDAYKKQYGAIKDGTHLNNPILDKIVEDTMKLKYWVPSRAELLKNQDLASFYFDFYFHKPAVAVMAMNDVAKSIVTNTATNKSYLTPQVINVSNTHTAKVYEQLWLKRELHYNNKYLNKDSKGKSILYLKSKRGVLNRLNDYSKTIAVASSSVFLLVLGIFF